jgi:hypothetical protein
LLSGGVGVSEWYQRLKEEKIQLADRLFRLERFIEGGRPSDMPDFKWDELVKQKNSMTEYFAILCARCEREFWEGGLK